MCMRDAIQSSLLRLTGQAETMTPGIAQRDKVTMTVSDS
jgi:hypothetical protein